MSLTSPKQLLKSRCPQCPLCPDLTIRCQEGFSYALPHSPPATVSSKSPTITRIDITHPSVYGRLKKTEHDFWDILAPKALAQSDQENTVKLI